VGVESVGQDGSGDAGGAGSMRMRIEFHDEEGGRTRLELRQGLLPVEVIDMAREGWLSSFTKLDKALAA
jgi:Activator of Hsp90 ATPase homolog 1-like protein